MAAHGAYASGLREAARLLGDPGVLPQRHFTENRRWREMMVRATRLFNVLSSSVSEENVEERVRILKKSDVFAIIPLERSQAGESLAPSGLLSRQGEANYCSADNWAVCRLPFRRFRLLT